MGLELAAKGTGAITGLRLDYRADGRHYRVVLPYTLYLTTRKPPSG